MPSAFLATSTQEIGLVSMKELFHLVTKTCSVASAPKFDTEMSVLVPLSFRTPTGQVNLASV